MVGRRSIGSNIHVNKNRFNCTPAPYKTSNAALYNRGETKFHGHDDDDDDDNDKDSVAAAAIFTILLVLACCSSFFGKE